MVWIRYQISPSLPQILRPLHKIYSKRQNVFRLLGNLDLKTKIAVFYTARSGCCEQL